MISRAGITRPYMHTRYPDGAAKFHGFGTPDRTCIEGIRKGLQDLTCKEHQTIYQDRAAGSHGFGPTYPVFNMPTRYQVGAAGSYG